MASSESSLAEKVGITEDLIIMPLEVAGIKHNLLVKASDVQKMYESKSVLTISMYIKQNHRDTHDLASHVHMYTCAIKSCILNWFKC